MTPTPPKDDPAAKAHAEALAKLRSLSGAAFDRAFLQHEAAFHQSVIDAVGSTLYSGTSEMQRNIISRWLGL